MAAFLEDALVARDVQGRAMEGRFAYDERGRVVVEVRKREREREREGEREWEGEMEWARNRGCGYSCTPYRLGSTSTNAAAAVQFEASQAGV